MSKVLKKSRLSLTLLLAVAFTFSAACSKGGNSTSGPAAAGRAYYEALNRKDYTGAMKYLSAGSIRKLEGEAKDLGKTLDAAYQEAAQKTGADVMPGFSNEKISGDTATVDFKGQGITVTMQMVKEGGEWKLALDKTFPTQRIFDSPSTGSSTTSIPTQSPSSSEDKEEEGGDDDEHNGHDEK
jgi:uncharacterized protein YlxW (UPF0749 family)